VAVAAPLRLVTTWDTTDPGNQRMDEQRNERARALVAGLGRPVRRALDVGCGRGTMLSTLGVPGVGIDVGLARLRLAPGSVAQADATGLPFPDRSFDLVVASNVFSSIPVEADRARAAAEIQRVLAEDGIVLWYDQRWPNPGNRSTRPVTRRDLARLFPGARADLETITSLPVLARAFPRRYDQLHRVGPLRSHLIGLLHPASGRLGAQVSAR